MRLTLSIERTRAACGAPPRGLRGAAMRVAMATMIAAVAALAASGCALVRLEAEVQDFDRSTVLVGRVESGATPPGPVVVGAWARNGDGWRLAHQTLLHEPGGYELIVPHGSYHLFAFGDRNGNGLFDPGEAAAEWRGEVTAGPGVPIVAGLDMVLGAAGVMPPRLVPAGRHSTQAGAPADLDAPAFAAERAAAGYWQPMTFFRELGGNVYFLEPYDPRKTPVLFVHGALGSPQDWRDLIGQLDRERFQPWVYFYPSGAPLDSMASLLGWKLLGLQLRYRYERLVVVAHSMGGLVVRRFLLDQGAALPQIRRFVSISTPWGGEPFAATGVRMSPAVVPSWREMQPDGPFVRALFERRLPAGIEYDLLFGHKGGYSLWRPNHDGTVTMASQLHAGAQREAGRVFGFDEDHTGILRSPQVGAQLRSLLAATVEAGAGGMVDVRLQVDGAPALGLPVLVLHPRATGTTAISVVLSAAERGGRVGPLPPGSYQAGLVAPGFAAEPRLQTVELGAGAERALNFRLRPDGSVHGFVQLASAATPAGSFGAQTELPPIREIWLRGAGVERVLAPQSDDGAWLRMAAGEDVAVGPSFVFSGLAEGEYELTILAHGLAPHRSTVRVTPGEPPAIAAITLVAPR